MTEPATPLIAFASDYGHADPFVGVCHLVLARTAPRARVVDLVHELDAHQVLPAATALEDAIGWLPAGAVLLAVVDPGVGGDRRGVLLAAGPSDDAASRVWLVGPDNGLLLPAAQARGGVRAAWALPVPDPPAGHAATFDGRDVFAPAAAHLATHGRPSSDAEPLDPAALVTVDVPRAEVVAGRISAAVVRRDRFGNLALGVDGGALSRAGLVPGDELRVAVGSEASRGRVATSFAGLAGGLGALPDAFGRLQVAVDRGSAAAALGAGVGDRVEITRD